MDNQPQSSQDLQAEPPVRDIVVAGGGGHAKVVIGILRRLQTYRILGYTDPQNKGPLLGIPWLGTDDELAALATPSEMPNVAIGVGQVGLGSARQKLWMRLQPLRFSFPAIVSPGAILNEGVSLGEGTVVMDGAVINCGATLGRGAIVNTNSTVEHDAVIGDWVHIAPGATICGDVSIGSLSMIGAGATVIEGRKITTCCVVGAGAAVVRDLTEPGIYVGHPARRIK